MLSAVAARKARLKEASSPEKPSPMVLDVSTPTIRKTTIGKPPSKRKSSQLDIPPALKKAKKEKIPNKKPRYFEPAVRAAEQDVILLGDEGADASVASDSDVGVEERLLDSVPVVGLQQPARRRVWSPSRPMPDSSDEDSADEDGPTSLLVDPMKLVSTSVEEVPESLSTFRPIPEQNSFYLTQDEATALGLSSDSALALVLPPSSTLSLVGTYQLRVLRGSVSLLGVRLHPSRISHRVFAPRSSPIPIIEALSERGESSKSTHPPLPARITSSAGGLDSVVVLQDLRSGVEGLGRVVRSFEGVFQPTRYEENDHDFSLSGASMLTRSSRDARAFYMPRSWETVLSSSLQTHPVAEHVSTKPMISLVRGPKNSGKSTLARTLLNRLSIRYRRVAFLECDLGQSEFTPGGVVALTVIDQPVFGPPFTHPTLPHQAHYIGSTSPRSSPSHYLGAIHALMQTYLLDLQFATSLVDVEESDHPEDDRIADVIPLVVNMMGWTKGLGEDLSRKIEAVVEPTDIFELEVPVEATWPTTQTEPFAAHSDEATIHRLEAIPPSAQATRFTAADHRTIALMSYFHAVFPSTPPRALQQVSAAAWNTALPLCAVPPYEVDTNVALDRVVVTGPGSEDVAPTELLRVLNGAVVGLVHSEEASAGEGTAYTQGAAAPDPISSTCVGLALVRGVSPEHLHVLTPVPPHLLTTARVLVKGELELPVWGMLDFRTENGDVAGVDRARVPYLRWGKGEGVGAERRRVRRNLMRKGQM
ncbi:hypothetical protein BV25DRAFT_1860655 [Artomyces pyxidatus]|uniref:Uncharacterized protein n=1 Tax=Artomyces pyxidatus TaxID=48021 RepID=A0ACB8ST31_9AGAM|nr:hypothetical protein BV25DRAFT_1860655 [Artomyces pyxidatus]